MRHIITGVVSVGHFDNFCCWQYGQDSSAHKDGIQVMLEEIGMKQLRVLTCSVAYDFGHHSIKSFLLNDSLLLPLVDGYIRHSPVHINKSTESESSSLTYVGCQGDYVYFCKSSKFVL